MRRIQRSLWNDSSNELSLPPTPSEVSRSRRSPFFSILNKNHPRHLMFNASPRSSTSNQRDEASWQKRKEKRRHFIFFSVDSYSLQIKRNIWKSWGSGTVRVESHFTPRIRQERRCSGPSTPVSDWSPDSHRSQPSSWYPKPLRSSPCNGNCMSCSSS